jgi:hypothetical protein
MRRLIEQGRLKVSVSYRDPRDCIVSVLDAADKNRKTGKRKDYIGIYTVEHALNVVTNALRTLGEWIKLENVLLLPYSTTASSPGEVLQGISDYTELNVDVESIMAELNVNQRPGRFNFNVGKAGRYREYFSQQQLQYVEQELKDFFTRYQNDLSVVMPEVGSFL